MQRLIVILVAATALPAAALAQDEAAASGRKTGLYLRGAVGGAFSDSFDQAFSYSPAFLPVVAPPTAKRTDIGAGIAWSAAVGFQYARTRTELEYRRFGQDSDEVALSGGASPSIQTDAGDVTAQAILSNVYFDAVNSSRLTPYLGLGVGGARVTNERGQRDAAFAYQVRAGLDIALTDALSVGVEYSYFRTLEVVYGPDEFDAGLARTATFRPEFERLDGDAFAASSVMAGARFVF